MLHVFAARDHVDPSGRVVNAPQRGARNRRIAVFGVGSVRNTAHVFLEAIQKNINAAQPQMYRATAVREFPADVVVRPDGSDRKAVDHRSMTVDQLLRAHWPKTEYKLRAPGARFSQSVLRNYVNHSVARSS